MSPKAMNYTSGTKRHNSWFLPTTNSDQRTNNPYLLRANIKYHNLTMTPTPTMIVYRVALATCDVESRYVCVCQMHGSWCNAFFIGLIYFRH